ncbi:hypothetical protein CV093_05150 [Oceanobacillus sp. 143]|uniref:WYL domain-containing protein n=1 Tax=Oceanobacillus zhaokaii TaxID=2052660 RepID=A0A345PE76_9BACI|nr:hypothetical protein [Oceanobacillus zhaokaii]AXI08306.1 hypothetical protein CUC15_04880 [Oceanobacillus zhaokaii]QGS68227.1 hypothetical protein CV093_05150 [Oceanobacillus sp. 143]
MKGLILRSMENKEKIVIFYIDQNNSVTKRIVKVVSTNGKLIAAYCYWRKQIRTFKLENILSAEPIRKRVGA